MATTLLYEIPYLYFAESQTFSEFADVAHNALGIFRFLRTGGNKLSHWNTPQRDLDGLSPGHFLQ
jgi:hypothetical protein